MQVAPLLLFVQRAKKGISVSFDLHNDEQRVLAKLLQSDLLDRHQLIACRIACLMPYCPALVLLPVFVKALIGDYSRHAACNG